MRQRRPQYLEAVAAAAGRAGKVHDEGLTPHAGDPTREQRMRSLDDRVGANRLGDPGHGALEHLGRRFRRDVTRREAGAAGGQHDRGLLRELRNRLGDRVAVVGHDAAFDLVALRGEQPAQQVAAFVLAGSFSDPVGDREHGGPHGSGSFVFSSKRTPASSIVESIAFAMS